MADLGFRWQANRRGEVLVRREGARITGNYRRGNERDAKKHPRNR
jgi:hypothetical protein